MENKKRLIDANALMNEVDDSKYNNPHTNGRVRVNHITEHDHFMRMIYDAPTVDAVEVVHGRWTATDVIVHKAGYGVRYYYHAECKVNPHRLFECENDYCPNCGAKMDGERKDNA